MRQMGRMQGFPQVIVNDSALPHTNMSAPTVIPLGSGRAVAMELPSDGFSGGFRDFSLDIPLEVGSDEAEERLRTSMLDRLLGAAEFDLALQRAARDMRDDVQFGPPGCSEAEDNLAASLATEFFRQVVTNQSAAAVEEARDHALAHGVAGGKIF